MLEATGIRDVPSGPLLRIGHDRFVPGLRRIADAVRQASDGETKLFIQLIDFLSIRRRPEPAKSSWASTCVLPIGIAPRWAWQMATSRRCGRPCSGCRKTAGRPRR
ncbi:MAG: hypothetical protein U1E89_06715 [Burkholderiaceae bacterium]